MITKQHMEAIRTGLLTLVLASTGAVAASAHHSYAEYDRDQVVSLEGEIGQVEWVNPHVLVILETRDSGSYRIEWSALSQLSRSGVAVEELKAGDHVVITGSLNRNPEKRIMTLLQEIERPADGWSWTRVGR